MTIRECKNCGKLFEARNGLAKYCPECASLTCCVCGGKRHAFIDGKAYCKTHYTRMMDHGTIGFKRNGLSANHFYLQDPVVYIVTTDGKYTFVADIEEYDKLKNITWHAHVEGRRAYAKGYLTEENNKHVKMQRYIMGVDDPNVLVDHINGDSTDNRKCNLRLCSTEENNRNRMTSGRESAMTNFNGVYYDKSHAKSPYRSNIRSEGKLINLGSFANLEEAKQARMEAEVKYYGEFAHGAVEVPPVPDFIVPKKVICPVYDKDDPSVYYGRGWKK